MNLDDLSGLAALDPADALGDVEHTPDQWRLRYPVQPVDVHAYRSVLITGMGGSGIAGDVTAALAYDRLPVPVLTHRGYGVPAFVGAGTLVVAVSSSGRTEETLSAVSAALERGARVLAVAGGGTLADWSDGVERIGDPPAGPQPRHSLGALVKPILAVLGLDDGVDEAIAVQQQVLARCGRAVPAQQNPAKQLAARLAGGGLAVLWGTQGLAEVAAYRLRCQLNENAKLPALHGIIPELNHNEVVGWEEPVDGIGGLVVLRDRAGEPERVAARVPVTVELVRPRVAWEGEILAEGRKPLARLTSLLLVADLVSVYTALALDRDPTPIASIDRLKAALDGTVQR